MLAMQIEEQKRKVSALVSEVQRAENGAKANREQMREELKKAEAENNQLRNNFRESREKLEQAQQDNRKALDDLQVYMHVFMYVWWGM